MRGSPIRLLVVLVASLMALVALGFGAALAPLPAGAQGDPALPDDLGPTREVANLAAPQAATPELLVVLASGQDPVSFARQHGMRYLHSLKSAPNVHVFLAASPAAARQAAGPAAVDPRVKAVYPNEHTRYERMAFVPNDPYFHRDTPSAGWSGQWHLLNEFVAGRDARVQGAWNNDVTGSGVTIGIVDDSLQTAHPDLSPNYVAADSWDFGQNDGDPSPVNSDDEHGISVAGVAAARGGNGVGVTGAAPLANLAGLRIDFPTQTTAMFVDATLYHSSGSNTSIKVKNHSYGYTVPYISSSAEVSALQTSAAAGTIHCFAAGNERGASGQDAGKKHLQASPDSITVAAMGSDGKFASYSNFGACVFVTAPSNSSTGITGITTTDRMTEAFGYNGSGDSFPNPDYTSQFGGTSSATPLVAGVMALVKQAQPALNARFAKHLLALTSDVVDASDATVQSDGGWRTNAAGRRFNQNYGFGLIDAAELVQKATQYSGVTPLTTAGTGTVTVNAAIPDNNATGVSRNFTLGPSTPLEEVLVTLSITHSSRGDVTAFLTSPSGTSSRLMIQSSTDSLANINWTFCSNAFWGENPAGTWTLNVQDRFAGRTGTWNSFAVTARMGQLQSPDRTLTPSPTSVTAGGPLSISWTAPAGSAYYDWIGLFPVGSPNTGEVWWMYTQGAASGTVNLNAPNTPAQYEFRYFLNNTRADVVRSVPVTVTAPPASSYSLTPSSTSVAASAPLSISWTAPAGSSSWDWIGLFRAGDPNSGEVWYAYTGGATSGTANLTAPSTPGDYEFRYLPNNGRADVKRSSTVTVTAPSATSYSLTPSPTTVAPGAPLSITWTAPPGSAFFDWIGLFPVGSPNTGERWWNYTWGATSGSYNLTAPNTPGQYEFRYFLNNTRTDVKRSGPITVN